MHKKFVPKTALLLSSLLLTAGGVAYATNTVYAGSYRGLGKQAVNWVTGSAKKQEPGKGMNKGYLVFHNSSKKKKNKLSILKARPYNKTGSGISFYNTRIAINKKGTLGHHSYYMFTIPDYAKKAGNFAGKIGCLYENAATFRPYDSMTAQHLDAAVIIVGWTQVQSADYGHVQAWQTIDGHKKIERNGTYWNGKHEKKVRNQVWFDRDFIGVHAQGKGSLSVALQFYDHKTHRPVYPKTNLVLKDMDARQYFSIGNLIKGGSKGDRLLYGYDATIKNKHYNKHTLTHYKDAPGKGPVNTTAGGDNYLGRAKDHYVARLSDGGTVYSHDPRGWIKFYDKWSQKDHPYVITFHHNIDSGPHTTTGRFDKHPYVARGLREVKAKKSFKSYRPAKTVGTHNIYDNHAGLDFFSIGATPDDPGKPHTDTGKMEGLKEKGDYYSNLVLANVGKSGAKKFYYDIYGSVNWPGIRLGGIRTRSQDSLNYQGLPGFELKDTVDPQLKVVGKIKVYQTASNTKYYADNKDNTKKGNKAGSLMKDSHKQNFAYLGHAKDVSYDRGKKALFSKPTVHKNADGSTFVLVKAKKKALKASNTSFYNHVYHLVIPVTIDKVRYNLTDYKVMNKLIRKGTKLDQSKDKIGSTHIGPTAKKYVTYQSSGSATHGTSLTTIKTVNPGKNTYLQFFTTATAAFNSLDTIES